MSDLVENIDSSAENSSPEEKINPLQNKYWFWYMKRGGGLEKESYEKAIKEFGSFETVGEFWDLFNYLIHPNDLPGTTDYHLFKYGIKPMWEDRINRNGGKWMIRIPKGLASRYWEDLVLAMIGEQFEKGEEICGAVISMRHNEDIISLWNKSANDLESCKSIRDNMRDILQLPQFVNLEYKRHDASMNDNSSFRNTTIWRGSSHNRAESHNSGNSKRDSRDHEGSSSYRQQKDRGDNGNGTDREQGDYHRHSHGMSRGTRGRSQNYNRYDSSKHISKENDGEGWKKVHR